MAALCVFEFILQVNEVGMKNEKPLEKSKSIIQRFAPILWMLAGVLFLLPSIFGSSRNHTSIGVGMMFIIFGIVFSKKK